LGGAGGSTGAGGTGSPVTFQRGARHVGALLVGTGLVAVDLPVGVGAGVDLVDLGVLALDLHVLAGLQHQALQAHGHARAFLHGFQRLVGLDRALPDGVRVGVRARQVGLLPRQGLLVAVHLEVRVGHGIGARHRGLLRRDAVVGAGLQHQAVQAHGHGRLDRLLGRGRGLAGLLPVGVGARVGGRDLGLLAGHGGAVALDVPVGIGLRVHGHDLGLLAGHARALQVVVGRGGHVLVVDGGLAARLGGRAVVVGGGLAGALGRGGRVVGEERVVVLELAAPARRGRGGLDRRGLAGPGRAGRGGLVRGLGRRGAALAGGLAELRRASAGGQLQGPALADQGRVVRQGGVLVGVERRDLRPAVGVAQLVGRDQAQRVALAHAVERLIGVGLDRLGRRLLHRRGQGRDLRRQIARALQPDLVAGVDVGRGRAARGRAEATGDAAEGADRGGLDGLVHCRIPSCQWLLTCSQRCVG
jgi:hypothetical protein